MSFRAMPVTGLALVLMLALGPVTALAGTTGAIRGRVVDGASGLPVAGAKVIAASPSQSATTTTDAAGSYGFISLVPDTYTLSASAPGFQDRVASGITVLADQTQNVGFEVTKLRVIGTITTRGNELVKPGTTSDVYSVNAAGQTAASGLGGPGGLNSAYSAIASVPGANVPQGQQGWFQSVFIRGGDLDQVGYELDGIPVNRAYDNAPQTMLSILGQQELQVYTGGTPAGADASGIAGYVNQVIKTGTYPGFRTFNVGVGGPAFYHKLSFEIGGATSDRNFTYYLGTAGVNQDYRYLDQRNGAGVPLFFYPLNIPKNGSVYDGSGTAAFSPGNSYAIANTNDRETVANFHFGIPHRRDALKDDVQLLYLTSEIFLNYYSSINDLGGPAIVNGAQNGGAPIPWDDGLVYTGPLYAPPQNSSKLYYFPGAPPHIAGSALPNNYRDGNDNGVGIVKLQYQKNFSSRSYARLYGYGLYSNWYITGPLSSFLSYGAELADYEIGNHTYGLNFSYANQLSDKHLIGLSASYVTSKLQRYTTTNGFPAFSPQGGLANFVGSDNNCYDPTTAIPGSVRVSCFSGPSVSPAIPNPTNPSGTVANGARWLVTENGYNANLNQVTPFFTAGSLSDQWKPSDRLTINAGLRVENYTYRLGDTTAPARPFWFQAYNAEYCAAPGHPPVPRVDATGTQTPLAPCPAGTTPVTLSNLSGGTQSNTIFQPRVGFTYALSGDSVIRGSLGRYARPANTSWVQYNTVQQNLASFLGTNFYAFGYTTPRHELRPDTSNNADFSLERHVAGTDLSFKITPFYRNTQNQLQNLNINALTGLFSGLNVGRQKSSGIELAVRKGDFSANGFSAQLAYTYTRSRVKYGNFPNGLNLIDNLNSYIQEYNSYTSACSDPSKATLCGGTTANAVATFNNGGVVVANPYYSRAPQPLLDRNAEYTTYDIIPGPVSAANGYEVPHVASAILNFKHNRFTVTPSFTYSSGASYGSPLVWPGYLPATCTGVSSGTTANPQTCTGSSSNSGLQYLFQPDPYTGKFDSLGDLKEPARFTANLQLGYEFSRRAKLRLTMTGLVDKCYQRGYAWDSPKVCVYGALPSAILAPVGNFAPLSATPVQLQYPYAVWNNNSNTGFIGTTIPFNAVLNLEIKL